MTISDPWHEFLAATRGYPAAPSPPALHGYLTAWAINFENRDEVPWIERVLGVEGPERIPDKVRSLTEDCLSLLSEQIGLFEYEPPAFDNEKDGEHWAQSWCRGFCDAVALDQERWEEYSSDYFTVARALLATRLLASAETYNKVTGKPRSEHPQFVARQGEETIPKAVFMMGDSILGDGGARRLFDGDDALEPDADIELPEFETEALRGYSNEALMELLLTLHDRVPKTVIEECAGRGEDIVPLLRDHIHDHMVLEEYEDGRWWGVLHCLHILGLIPGPEAAHALLDALEVRQTDPDDYVWEWVSGCWPALFANKHEHARSALAAIAGDNAYEWALRADVMECLAADTEEQETHLDRIAAVAGDETEKDLVREMAGSVLLNYPRDRHRELLHRLAERQARRTIFGLHFDEMDVHFAYWEQDRGRHTRPKDPWSFYQPAAILERQRRWLHEAREAEQRALLNEPAFTAPAVGTYVRDIPKIGRNDPCPCGSGKKYKKCCLDNRP